MSHLDLSFEEILSTTKAVRQRLDLERPVGREVLMECFELANFAPSSRNSQPWHFLVITDKDKRQLVGDLYREVWDLFAKPMYESAMQNADNEGERKARYA